MLGAVRQARPDAILEHDPAMARAAAPRNVPRASTWALTALIVVALAAAGCEGAGPSGAARSPGATPSASGAANRLRLLVDTDMAADDIVAIASLAADPGPREGLRGLPGRQPLRRLLQRPHGRARRGGHRTLSGRSL